MSSLRSDPGFPRKEEQAARRRLLLFGVLLVGVPALLVLGWLGYGQLAAQRDILMSRSIAAAEAEARRVAAGLGEALTRDIEQRLAAPPRQGATDLARRPHGTPSVPLGEGWVRLDAAGRLLAPSLPPAFSPPPVTAEVQAGVRVGRDLEFYWHDPQAAAFHYRRLLQETPDAPSEARVLTELLATEGSLSNWASVRALADRLLALDAEGGGALLPREAYLCARMAQIEALCATGNDAGETVQRFRRELILSSYAQDFGGAGFYLGRLKDLASNDPAGGSEDREVGQAIRSGFFERALQAGVGPAGRIVALGPTTLSSFYCLRPRPGSAGVEVAMAPFPGAARRLREALDELVATGPTSAWDEAFRALPGRGERPGRGGVREGIHAAILDPARSERIEAGVRSRSASTTLALDLPGPLAGWTLQLHLAPAAAIERTFTRQVWVFGATLGLSALGILGSVFLLVRRASRAIALAQVRADFLAGVTHDLKTPLTLIRMYAETLRLGRASSDAEQNRFLDTILLESLRLQDLIENVLSLQARPHARLGSSDLAATVAEAVKELSGLDGRGVRIEIRLAPDLPAVPHDPQGMVRVVRNLVENAVKFSPPGSRVLVVLRTDGSGIRLEVDDEGPGVPEPIRERVFEPFERGEASEPGTGLGLAVAREIVAAHGGEIRIEEREEPGARFVVRLPASNAQ